MIDAIVAAIADNYVVVIPTEESDLNKLIGKKAVYTDSGNRQWNGKVVRLEDPGVAVEFDNFPTGIGQGQILEIEDSA